MTGAPLITSHTDGVGGIYHIVTPPNAPLAVKVAAILDSYAPIARGQRGCRDGCGCTDCEMVEDLRAALSAAVPA